MHLCSALNTAPVLVVSCLMIPKPTSTRPKPKIIINLQNMFLSEWTHSVLEQSGLKCQDLCEFKCYHAKYIQATDCNMKEKKGGGGWNDTDNKPFSQLSCTQKSVCFSLAVQLHLSAILPLQKLYTRALSPTAAVPNIKGIFQNKYLKSQASMLLFT